MKIKAIIHELVPHLREDVMRLAMNEASRGPRTGIGSSSALPTCVFCFAIAAIATLIACYKQVYALAMCIIVAVIHTVYVDKCVLSGSMSNAFPKSEADWQGRRARALSAECYWTRTDDVPIGVMRERGMARCCMTDTAEMAVLGSEDGGSRVQGAEVGCDVMWDVLSWLGGKNCGGSTEDMCTWQYRGSDRW